MKDYLIKDKRFPIEGILDTDKRADFIRNFVDLFNIIKKDNFDVYFIVPTPKQDNSLPLGQTTISVLDEEVHSDDEAFSWGVDTQLDDMENVEREVDITSIEGSYNKPHSNYRIYLKDLKEKDEVGIGNKKPLLIHPLVIIHDKDTDTVHVVPNGKSTLHVGNNDEDILFVLLDYLAAMNERWLVGMKNKTFSKMYKAELNIGTKLESDEYDDLLQLSLKAESKTTIKRETHLVDDSLLSRVEGIKHSYADCDPKDTMYYLFFKDEYLIHHIETLYEFNYYRVFENFMNIKNNLHLNQSQDGYLDIDMKVNDSYDDVIQKMKSDVSFGEKMDYIKSSEADFPRYDKYFNPVHNELKVDKNEHYEPLKINFKQYKTHKNSNRLIRQVAEVGNPYNLFLDEDMPEVMKSYQSPKTVNEKYKELKDIGVEGDKKKIHIINRYHRGGYGAKGYEYVIQFIGAYSDIVAFLKSGDMDHFYSTDDFVSALFRKHGDLCKRNEDNIYNMYTMVELYVFSQNHNGTNFVTLSDDKFNETHLNNMHISYNRGSIVYRDSIQPLDIINQAVRNGTNSVWHSSKIGELDNVLDRDVQGLYDSKHKVISVEMVNDEVTQEMRLQFDSFREHLESI